MPRINATVTLSLSPASHDILNRQKALYGGNASKGLDAALREFAEHKGWFDTLGIEAPPEVKPEPPPFIRYNPMRIEILPTAKSAVPMYTHNGEMYAETPAAGDYIIRLINKTPDRVEAVVSVDGIDVLNGKDACYQNRGWIVAPYGTTDIPGWFRSHQEVAAFQFSATASGEGYAQKTGRGAENVGIIGVAVFKEKVVDPLWLALTQVVPNSSPVYGSVTRSVDVSCSASLDGGRASMSYSVPDVSTGYGKKVEAHSTSVAFNRAKETPDEVLELRYATRSVLQSWGVPMTPMPPRANPFPGNLSVPAPTGWRG